MKRGRIGLLLLATVLIGPVVARAPRLIARLRRRRALARTLRVLHSQETEDDLSPEVWDDHPREDLVGFEDPEALLALADDWRFEVEKRRHEPYLEPETLVLATELFALEPEPRDPRPRAAFEALARNPATRLWARYLLAELEHPRHSPEPDGFAPEGARIHARWPDALAAIRSVASLPIDAPAGDVRVPAQPPVLDDTPWRALVRLAQLMGARVTLADGRVRLVPEPRPSGGATGFLGIMSSETLRELVIPRELATGETLPPVTLTALAPAAITWDLPIVRRADLSRVLALAAAESGLVLSPCETDTVLEARIADRSGFIDRLGEIADGRRSAPVGYEETGHAELLVGFDEPEAFLAVLAWFAKQRADDAWAATRTIEAGILSAARSPDPRIATSLDALDHGADRAHSFVALYLLEELASPSYPPPPPELANAAPAVFPGHTSAAVVAAIASATRLAIQLPEGGLEGTFDSDVVATPWRALLRVALANGCGVTVTGQTVRLVRVPDGKWDAALHDPEHDERVPAALAATIRAIPYNLGYWPLPDSAKALRALARLEGCTFVEMPDGKLAFVKKTP